MPPRLPPDHTPPAHAATTAAQVVAAPAAVAAELAQLRHELSALRQQYDTLANGLPHRVFVKDRQSRYLFVNDHYARTLGQAPHAVLDTDDFAWFPKALAERYRMDDQLVMQRGEPLTVVEPFVEQGNSLWIRTTKVPVRDDAGKVTAVLGVFEDVTAEYQLRWTLETLLRCSAGLARARREAETFQAVCTSLTEQGVFRLAWVGIPRHDADKTIDPVVICGAGAGYLGDDFAVRWDDSPLGRGPAGRAIRERKTQVLPNLTKATEFTPWSHRARANSLDSCVTLPILLDDEPVAILAVYAEQPNRFGAQEVTLLEQLAADVASTLRGLRLRDRLEEALAEQQTQRQRTEQLFERTIAAIAATVERRDPYTSGHEARVAALAVAIGQELKLTPHQLQGLRLAALVHDLGKIQVPFEILNKPGRLSPIEYDLVKTHAEAGYMVLKGLDFPWPLADMVHQHHEALDGTGYPQGLRGDQILPESRILTVADIVESMSSHRPYRPSLGLDRALEEIQRLRGTKLDPVVVDACLKLAQQGLLP